MPPRLVRRHQTGQLHFLTFSCHNRDPYFTTPAAKTIFEHSLEQTRRTYQWTILGYVVMPEHIHLLVDEPPTHPLSTVVGALKRSVSKRLPQTPFWLARYHDVNIYSQDHRIEHLRYLHRNPVTRGLCLSPSDYPWSSFTQHLHQTPGIVQITTKFP